MFSRVYCSTKLIPKGWCGGEPVCLPARAHTDTPLLNPKKLVWSSTRLLAKFNYQYFFDEVLAAIIRLQIRDGRTALFVHFGFDSHMLKRCAA